MSESNDGTQPRFNLVDEPWIPCVYVDGHVDEVYNVYIYIYIYLFYIPFATH